MWRISAVILSPKTAGTGMIAMSLPGYSFRTYLTFPLAGYFGGAAEGEALSGTQEIIVSIDNAAAGNALRFNFTVLVKQEAE